MITVKIIFLNGETDIKDCWNVDEICLDGVEELKILRDERYNKQEEVMHVN